MSLKTNGNEIGPDLPIHLRCSGVLSAAEKLDHNILLVSKFSRCTEESDTKSMGCDLI